MQGIDRMNAASLARMRRELAVAARARTTVTYGQLMNKHRLSRGGPLTRAIEEVDREEYRRGSPGFAAIIVRKDTGFPGGGFFVDEKLPRDLVRKKERSTDPRLSAREKRYVKRQQERIWTYYRARHD